MKPMNEKPTLNSLANNSQRYKPRPNLDKLRSEKRNFLKEFGSKYGYGGKVDQIREEEYPQLRNEVYLDHTGSTTFAKSAVINFHNDILNNLYGNPHSNSPSSMASSHRVEGVRKRILKHFNTTEKDYNVIFTYNATAAVKLAGEMFPWTNNSTYRYLRESHNSINGLRRFLEAINPENITNVTENDVRDFIKNSKKRSQAEDVPEDGKVTYNLFAYPAQCNYSGMRFPLSWCHQIKKADTKYSRTLVLLDAAAFVPSASLSLADKDASPDFVCLSFYKMFGYPTGLGALIIKTELNPIIRKGYFGGGTMDSVAFNQPWQKFSKKIPVRYEDGTVNFLNIIALDHAFDAFERIYGTTKNISNHVTSLNTFLSRNMASLRHWNGQTVIKINSDRDYSNSKTQGGIFSFNVRRSGGDPIGYFEIDKLASSYGIHIRAGGNCNPGSVSRWNNIVSDNVIEDYDEGKFCSDEQDIFKGRLYGAARISIGAMTTIEDVLIWLDFFKRHYVEIMPGKTIHELTTMIPKSKFGKIDFSTKIDLSAIKVDYSSEDDFEMNEKNEKHMSYTTFLKTHNIPTLSHKSSFTKNRDVTFNPTLSHKQSFTKNRDSNFPQTLSHKSSFTKNRDPPTLSHKSSFNKNRDSNFNPTLSHKSSFNKNRDSQNLSRSIVHNVKSFIYSH